MSIFIAMAWWLLINYLTGWLPFSALLCIFAGLFLVMPGLIHFSLRDFSLVKKEKTLTVMNGIVNSIIIPAIFVVVWILFFPENKEIWYSLALLGILPGGWLLMSWIRQSRANAKYGFVLFVFNMTVFILLFFVLNYLIMHNFTDTTLAAQVSCELETVTQWVLSCTTDNAYDKPLLAYLFLLLIPFGISRILRKYEIIKTKMQKYIPLISKIATFFIIVYVFSLQNIHGIFDQDVAMVVQVFIAVFVAYLLVFALSYALYRYQNNMTDFSKSFFWNSTIRFITLGIIFGVVYVPYLWVTYITIFASAYIIQTLLSMLSLRLMYKH